MCFTSLDGKSCDFLNASCIFLSVCNVFFILSLQEIYPPKLHEFAYVTDGACSEEDIIQIELIILKVCLVTFSC